MSIIIDTLQIAIEFSLSFQVSVVTTLSFQVLTVLLLKESLSVEFHKVKLDTNCILKRRYKRACTTLSSVF